MGKIEGGCLCGQVRYSAAAEPMFEGVCHCTHCQKQSGTAFSVIIGVQSDALTVTGTLKTFEDRGESGQPVHRQFCPDCGSPVISLVDAMPGFSFIKAGTLDDPSWLAPKLEIWCRSAQPWVPHPEGTRKFDQGRA